MRIRFPWERPEPITLLWRNLPGATPVLRKSTPRPRSAFLRLVDQLASPNGRAKYRSLLRELNDDLRLRRAPRIVGIAR